MKHHVCKIDHTWNPTTCACKINRSLKSIADSIVTCDEFIDAVAKSCNNVPGTMSINLNDKETTCKMDNYYILLTFY